MTVPLVSVVIPCFNGGKYLREAIDSVLTQGKAVLEIVVSDDGSTDNSVAIARSYSERVLCVSNPHKGLPAALNAGLKATRAELIGFIDADDVWPSGRLDHQLELLHQKTEIDVVLGTLRRFVDKNVDGVMSRETMKESLKALSLGAALFRRRVFETVGDFDESLFHGNDIDWFLRAQEGGVKILSYDDVSLLYRRHEANMSNDAALGSQYLLAIAKQAMARRRKKMAPHHE